MKKFFIILILLLSTAVPPFSSYAGWMKVAETVDDHSFYVDLERVSERHGYVYFWYLTNFFKPNKRGYLSFVGYKKADCKMFKYKFLSSFSYKQTMGLGVVAEVFDKPDNDWGYAPPDTVAEALLKAVCSR